MIDQKQNGCFNTISVTWKIRAICSEEKRKNPDAVIDYRTVGFDKYGFGEIMVVGKVKNHEKIMNMVNTFGRMLASGEKFEAGVTHTISNSDGEIEFCFCVVYVCFDSTKYIQLIPDFEKNISLPKEKEYKDGGIYYLNNRPYIAMKSKDKEIVLVRQDKLVWTLFVDNSLNASDESWELGYKDGNYRNCAVFNLFRVK